MRHSGRKPKGSKKLEDFNIISTSENGWRIKASCNKPEVSTSWFFATPKSPEANRALKICSSCPVRTECLYDAFLYQYQGIWGGYTEELRNKIIITYLNNDLTSFTLEQAQEIINSFDPQIKPAQVALRQVNKKR